LFHILKQEKVPKLFYAKNKILKKNYAHNFKIIFLVGEHKNFLWCGENFEYFYVPLFFEKQKWTFIFVHFLK